MFGMLCMLAFGVFVSSARAQIFVAGMDQNSVAEYSASGDLINASLISGLSGPASSMTVSGSDLFILSDGTIGEYTTSGATVNASLVTGVNNTSFVVSGSDIFAAKGNTIGEYTTSGVPVNTSLITASTEAINLTISGSDLFFLICENIDDYIIQEYTTLGNLVNMSLSSFNASPLVGFVAPGSDLFILNGFQNGMSELTTSGLAANFFTLSNLSSQATSMTVSGSTIYVSDFNPNSSSVAQYTTSGAFISKFSTSQAIGQSKIGAIAVGSNVPEPSAWVLVFVGGSLLFLFRRRGALRLATGVSADHGNT